MMSQLFFSRAGRAGPNDVAQRMPELAPLRHATISVFGLGCLGAPSAMEFARAGVSRLRVLDHDIVDPATMGRWPLGVQAAGLPKGVAIIDEIKRQYPFTTVEGIGCYLGSVRKNDDQLVSEQQTMRDMTADTSLIYDATAEIGIQHYLSDYALSLGVPYVSVDATAGGWGGRIVAVRPGITKGCWLCYQHARVDGEIPDPPMHHDDEIQPVGCGEPTFTGSGFDLVQIALTAVRSAVSVLCAGREDGYPTLACDVITVALRTHDGRFSVPQFHGYQLERHPNCPNCNSE